MAFGFNCKTTLWYFLCILFCKNYRNDDDIEENEDDLSKPTKTDDIIGTVKSAICRAFARHKPSNQFKKSKPNFTNEEVEPGKIKLEDECIIFKVVQSNESEKSLENVQNLMKSDVWIIGDFEDVDDDRLRFPVEISDDDESSSISDVTSEKLGFDESNIHSDESIEEQFSKTTIEEQSCQIIDNSLNSEECEKQSTQDYATNSKEEYIDVEIPEELCKSINDNMENYSTFPSTTQENEISIQSIHNPISFAVSESEDFWEFFDETLKEPLEFESSSNHNEDGSTTSINEAMSNVDSETLSDKIKWLIPFKAEHLEAYINSATLHFFQAKTNNLQNNITTSLIAASKSFPKMYTELLSIVTETEIGDALIDSTQLNSYIDRRAIFHLIFEIFSDIYSTQRNLPQMPWIQLSSMVKKKNYSLWKGPRPPETYDLVNKIVREQIYQILNQNYFLDEDLSSKSPVKLSHLNVKKWCDKKYREKVDILLTKEVRSEENEWLHYDDIEELLKFQIADDILNYIVTDATSWLSGVMDNSG